MKKYSDWFKVDWSNKTKTNDYQGNFDIGTLKQKLIPSTIKIMKKEILCY